MLLAPSWVVLQELIDVLHAEPVGINALVNVTKTFVWYLTPLVKCKIVSFVFRNLSLGDKELNFVDKFKYLGHLISCDLSDDIDIKHEICTMFVCINTFSRRFSRCSLRVVILYRAF